MKDLRDFIATCEKEGELRRDKAEVDWDLELSHIYKVVEEKSGPALLFAGRPRSSRRDRQTAGAGPATLLRLAKFKAQRNLHLHFAR